MTGKGTKGKNKKMIDNNDFIVNIETLIQDQSYVGMKAYEKIFEKTTEKYLVA